MAKQERLEDLDAATLYRLAKEKEKAERMAQESERRNQLRDLHARRREILERHRRELAAIDRDMAASMPSASKRRLVGDKRVRRAPMEGPSIGGTLCSIIGEKPEMPIEEIRQRATEQGISLKTVTQMLAYLKRTGRLTSARRGVYKVVPGQEMF